MRLGQGYIGWGFIGRVRARLVPVFGTDADATLVDDSSAADTRDNTSASALEETPPTAAALEELTPVTVRGASDESVVRLIEQGGKVV